MVASIGAEPVGLVVLDEDDEEPPAVAEWYFAFGTCPNTMPWLATCGVGKFGYRYGAGVA